jgi:hypothetical protein
MYHKNNSVREISHLGASELRHSVANGPISVKQMVRQPAQFISKVAPDIVCAEPNRQSIISPTYLKISHQEVRAEVEAARLRQFYRIASAGRADHHQRKVETIAGTTSAIPDANNKISTTFRNPASSRWP